MLNTNDIKKDFPILSRKVNGKDLIYLDNAATSQKPKKVLDAIVAYYENSNANVHRGVHTLSEEASEMYDSARARVARFIGATHPEEVVFTKGTTESINRVAFEWGMENLSNGDEIMFVEADHHSNIVPWQVVAQRTGAKLVPIEITTEGEIDLISFKNSINKNTKLVSISHASNVLGTIFPVKEICKIAKEYGAVVSVDGAQGAPHLKVNVQSLGCDFYSFSGHKMLGPMGIGVLWTRKEILEKMPPYEYGGGMIKTVSLNNSTYTEAPEKFEAGTPNVAGAIGLAVAMDYLEEIGLEEIVSHEQELIEYALLKLSEIEGVSILGPKESNKRTGLVAFVVDDIHPHDVATVLSSEGIAVRSGQHCAMPLHENLGITSSTRASFYIYNTKEDIDALVVALRKAQEILG